MRKGKRGKKRAGEASRKPVEPEVVEGSSTSRSGVWPFSPPHIFSSGERLDISMDISDLFSHIDELFADATAAFDRFFEGVNSRGTGGECRADEMRSFKRSFVRKVETFTGPDGRTFRREYIATPEGEWSGEWIDGQPVKLHADGPGLPAPHGGGHGTGAEGPKPEGVWDIQTYGDEIWAVKRSDRTEPPEARITSQGVELRQGEETEIVPLKSGVRPRSVTASLSNGYLTVRIKL